MGNRTPGTPSGPPRRTVLPPKKKTFGATMDARRIDEADRSPRVVSSLAMSVFAVFVRLFLFGLAVTVAQLGYQIYVKAYQGAWFSLTAYDVLAMVHVNIPMDHWSFPFLSACSPGVVITVIAFVGCIISQFFMRRA